VARSQGADLALLLLAGFQSMVDEVVAGLARRGHPGVRPAHEFALRAIDGGADTASELGRRLSVSKQAAAKTIAALEGLGYVDREADPADARRKRIRVTPRGHEMVAIGSALFEDVRRRWAAQIGAEQLEALEAHLRELVHGRSLGVDDLEGLDGADAAGR
jgi:DNA-binding MarR family transcriptional regulator